MKNFWSLILIAMVFAVPSFAQLTPSDSTIAGNITVNRVLNKNKVYLLQGFVYVKDGATLTIPAGTLILGESSTQGSLIVERGGKLIADGTAQEPIVFTSQQPAGLRSRGDWGGIVLCGRAANNRPGGNFVVEGNIGSIAGYGDAGYVQDDNDNSGILRYVRIEFSGIPFTPNNEINGLTLGAVGRGTTLEHIMVSYNGDDGFEFFGGTVNAKYLISYKNYDDDFDTDFGYSGKIQFGVVVRDPQLADVSKSEGFESDNDGTGTTASPRTSPIFSNMTVVGPKRLASDVSGTNFHTDFYYGIHHRRATRLSLFNSVFMGFDEGGIFLDGTSADTANFTYKNNVFTGVSKLIEPVTHNSWFTSYNNTLLPNPNDVLLKAPYNQTSPVLVPQVGSVLLSGASFTDPKVADPFFTATSYRGAFSGNGAQRWDIGWANYDPQGNTYSNPNLVWSSLINLTSATGFTKSVIIGRGNGATDNVDPSFGEANLPPVPPTGVDIRSDIPTGSEFVAIDIRSNATTSSIITYTLVMQDASVLNWDPNFLGAGKFTLKDGIGGGAFADLDMKANSSQVVNGLSTVIIEVDTRFNQTIVVGDDWNLVSFPGLHPNNMSVDTLYRGRDLLTPVYQYTTSTGYQTATTMVPGRGYWMFHNNVRTYTWNGTVQTGILYPKLNYAARNGYAAEGGWSMIGGYEYSADVNFIRTMPENRKTGLVFRYVPGAGYSSVNTLEPGLGHWVELTGAATIYVPGSFAATLGKNPLDELINADWGKIFITDAQGQHYTLYAANGSPDLRMFNLPPLPPANLFDVRFGSQKFVENLSNAQTINLTGVVYPVTVSVDGMDLRLKDAIDGSIINTVVKNGSSYVIENSAVSVLKVGSENVVPNEYSLDQNYPNPFNPSTTIKFSVPEISNVKLTIYNALGQKVAELVNSTLEAGSYSFNWDASNVASGLYFYELNTNNFSSVKKMMLMK